MPQAIIFTDEKENDIVEKYSKEWKISKSETIREIIKRFDEQNATSR